MKQNKKTGDYTLSSEEIHTILENLDSSCSLEDIDTFIEIEMRE